ncbi:PH domain-containing protein [Nocardia sp. NPDC048505]|uniref:PH domain-containing protein n=1 Tax=unclassified Nocardia TaxID=2637762 RepID=UPI0033CA9150
MLLVHPVTELVKFIPVLIGTVLLGTSSGNHLWSLVPLVLIVAFALTRWFTTSYRVGPTHVELRTGLIQRKKLSVPRSRIRSVDIEADLLRRVLGLAVVVIGTGKSADSEDRFKLDALDARVVPGLRTELLAHTGQTSAPQPVSDVEPEPVRAREIGHWQPGWARFAPLSLTGFAVVAPVVGLAFQYGLGSVLFESRAAQDIGEGGAAVIVFAVLGLLAAIVLVVSLAACTRYLLTYHGLRVLDDGRTLHVRHGLLTTRQITMDLARFRGATVKEPLLLRLAGAAELEAIMVGEKPRLKLLPQAPRAAVERTLAELLGPRQAGGGARPPESSSADLGVVRQQDSSGTAVAPRPAAATGTETAERPRLTEADPASLPAEHRPVARFAEQDSAAPAAAGTGGTTGHAADPQIPVQASAPLTSHGPVARRRRYTRALTPAALIVLLLAVLYLTGVDLSPWWLLLPAILAALALPLAEDRYRGLGHTVIPATASSPAWLITRSGSLDRARDCLEAPGIIGWTVRQSFWQRRAGVATVIAATAAGNKRYRVIDISLDRAWALIESVTPGRLGARPDATA